MESVPDRGESFAVVHRSRRSVREYTGELVSRELLTAIVEEAALAPSSRNGQPWRVVAVRGDELERVLPAMGRNAAKTAAAGTLLVLFADLGDDLDEAARFAGDLAKTPVEAGVRDVSLLAMSLMDVAWSYGIATRAMIGVDAARLRSVLEVPSSWHPVLTMTLGHPAAVPDDPAETRRQPVHEVLRVIG